MPDLPTGAPKLLIFTDLDGTLLDHESYDWSPAAPALARARAAGVPVIPATSKTRAELAPLMAALAMSASSVTVSLNALRLR